MEDNHLSENNKNNTFKVGLEVDPILKAHPPTYAQMELYFKDTFHKLKQREISYSEYLKTCLEKFSLNEVQIALFINGAHEKLLTHPVVKKWSEIFINRFENINVNMKNTLPSFLLNVLDVNRDFFSIDTQLSNCKYFEMNDERTNLTVLKKVPLKDGSIQFIEFVYDVSGKLMTKKLVKGSLSINSNKSEEQLR